MPLPLWRRPFPTGEAHFPLPQSGPVHAEAATKEEFAGRLTHYADHFWLLFEDEKLVSFVDGFVTDTPDLTDEMYADASLHDAHGAWQMIFGVNTLPEYRKQG